jgi:hypothetical protein
VRFDREQPVTLRVYREGEATTMCAINESPWPVSMELPVEVSEPTLWRELGAAVAAPSQQAPGSAAWAIVLPPYGIVARQYQSRTVRVGTLSLGPSVDAREALAMRIGEIEDRMRGLDVERSYPQLQNPDFELVGGDGLMLGWQPRVGRAGLAAIDHTAAAVGARALHLRSEDALGVAAQSNLFAIPATGQLTVRAKIRAMQLAAETAIHVWVEYDAGGAVQQKSLRIEGRRLNGDWTTCDVAFDDLPMASTGQMRVLFHLAGAGEAWIDGVELFDLRFADGQRMELVKRVYAAKTALDGGQLVDCQKLVDGYWPRYLIEYLPASPKSPTGPPLDRLPTEGPLKMATRPEASAPAESGDQESTGLGGRLRSIFR